MKFREEIQGLRALAVLIVIFFHLGLSSVSGGYIGVDVFFVISGFLITNQLLKEIKHTGRIDFGAFYWRRARRLMPALCVTVILTFAVAALVMTPVMLRPVAGSSIAALGYVSNIFFWGQSGYFDSSAITKPMLHTWSLSVEEQFYLFWPLLLFAVLVGRPKRSPVPLVAFICVTSYGLVLAFDSFAAVLPLKVSWIAFLFKNAAATEFFWLPFRLFEFGLGAAAIFLLSALPPLRLWVAGGIQLFGLFLISATAVSFTEHTGTAYLIIPCIGAVLVIIGGDKSPASILLTNPAARRIGEISYSLYLVHWPVIVFYRYLTLRSLNVYDAIGLAVLMWALAELTYNLVENRFRHTAFALPSLAKALSGFGAVATAVGILFWASSTGWPWRYDEIIRNFDTTALQQETVHFTGTKVTSQPFDEGLKILVIGDSHGGDVSNGLRQVFKNDYSVRYIPLNSFCLHYLKDNIEGALKDINCRDYVEFMRNSSLIVDADRIIMTFDWLSMTAPFAANLPGFVLKQKGTLNGALLLGADIHFKDFPELALRYRNPDKINQMAASVDLTEKVEIDKHLAKVAADYGIRFRRKIPLMCTREKCDFMSARTTLFVYDESHWTLEGANVFMSRLVKRMPRYFAITASSASQPL